MKLSLEGLIIMKKCGGGEYNGIKSLRYMIMQAAKLPPKMIDYKERSYRTDYLELKLSMSFDIK